MLLAIGRCKAMHKNKFYVFHPAHPRQPAQHNGTVPALREGPRFLSLFSGAMGLDLGLEAAGFQSVLCLDNDPAACATIRANRPAMPVIEDTIKNWTGAQLCSTASIDPTSITCIVGGPPCPSFSTAGRRRSFSDPRGEVMFDFLRIVSELRPPFFVLENVRGILSAAIKHRPVAQRGNGHHPLEPPEQLGSVLRLLQQHFCEMGYTVTAELVNAADYGVPQHRERVIFFGSRDGYQLTLPMGEFAQQPNMFQQPWRNLRSALAGMEHVHHTYQPFSETRKHYLSLLTAGQNWRNLPSDLLPQAMGGAYEASGGRVGFYRRLAWDKPSPTLPTSPAQKSTMLCHPDELRPLSVQEYARIQQFPDTWQVQGSLMAQYRQLGNAVPVGLGYVIGRTLLRYLTRLEHLQ
jgi:DNA (cytosine-5)-methyltransferase 1